MSSLIPEEICRDILLRVPVKSIFVCKCVCKSWFSIISDPDFVKLHLNLAITRRNDYRLLLIGFNDKISSGYSVSYESLSSSNRSDVDVVKLDFPYKSSSKYTTELFGSCNGLVYGWNIQMKFFYLWNPATQEYKRLPKLQDTDYNPICRFHGFGYDYKTQDYKLVAMKDNNLVQVYSLKSDSWKSSISIEYGWLFRATSGVLLNGALHWLRSSLSEASSAMMVSINISEERFEELQLPMTLPTTITTDEMYMGVLEDCLCVLAHMEKTFQVWVMQDYGVSDSWTKIYTIAYESMPCSDPFDVKLIGSFKDDEILFKNICYITLYDPRSGATRKRKAVSYFESLVSLNSVTAVGRRKKREITRNLGDSKTKKRNRTVPEHRGG